MGKYMAQAATFSGAVGSVAGSLSGIDGKCSGIQDVISNYSTDVICSNVSSRLAGIQSAKDAIVENLRSIAQKVIAEAKRLDDEEEKRRLRRERLLAEGRQSVEVEK